MGRPEHMSRRSHTVIAALVRRRIPVLVLIALITAVFGYFLTTVSVNNDPRTSIPPDLKEMADYNRLQEIFNTPRTVLVVAEFEQMSLREKVDSLASWAAQFEALEGVASVIHLGAIKVPVRGGLLGLSSDYIVPRKGEPTDQDIRERIAEYHEFSSAFVSADEQAMGMLINIDENRNQARAATNLTELQARINTHGKARLFMTGAPLYAHDIDMAMRRDFRVLLPLCLLIVFALLLWVFGRLYYVVASLAIIAVALIWTFGLMGITGIEFSVVTAMIPVILFPIGVASAIHVFKTYTRTRQHSAGMLRIEAIQVTFSELLNPIFLSAITTFFGFISFAFSKTLWTRNFGIFTSIGVALALLLSIVLLPIVLHYDRREHVRAGWTLPARLGGPEWLWDRFQRFTAGSYWWVVVAVVIAGASTVGYFLVHVEGNPIGMFSKHSEIVQTDSRIAKHLGGTRFMSVVLSRDDGPIGSLEHWEDVARISSWLDSNSMVSSSTSLLPLLHRVSRMLSDTSLSEPALNMLLGGRGMLGRSFGRYIDAWVTPDRQYTKITLLCRNETGTKFIRMARELQRDIPRRYPGWQALVVGPPVLNDAMTYLLIHTQVSSVLSTFVLVFAVLCLLFRSWRIGAVSVVPIIFSTGFVYALMGFFGVAINSVTIITVNTCIGIGIDYAIHFTAGYLYVRGGYAGRVPALMDTVRSKGAVIVFNTMVVGVGFLVLTFSTFPPIRHFGVFVFVSMLASCLFALLFLPALFARFEASPKVGRHAAPQRHGDTEET